MINENLFYIKEHLIKTCDLPEFIETESGVNLKWNRDNSGACCACPMPDHYETKPSFHINKIDDEVWVYHCFGCQKKGTIIHFCMDYMGIRSQIEAINYLCKYYNINNVSDLILEGIKNVSKKVNYERQIENEHILVSNQCRMLLRRNFEKNKDWVFNAYKQLNEYLLQQDEEGVQKIGYEASKRMREK